ncbi:hypothetical protein N9263_01910 [Candidatus Marinimicrobia bacterium]|nr:hypothetical protein [Candidatus Neomarinimicrobiota bacterium]
MSNPVFLEITDITWELPKDNKDDLPGALELQWNNRKWTNAEVSLWLTEHFNFKVNSLNIKELVNKTSSG